MKKYLIILLIITGCGGIFQSEYDANSAFLLAEIRTLSMLGQDECGKELEANYIRLTWEKGFLLLNYTKSIKIPDSRNYAIEVFTTVDDLYQESISRDITNFYCKEQFINLVDLVKVSMDIEQLRK